MKQVVAKMKSKHMAGTFTKKKKCKLSFIPKKSLLSCCSFLSTVLSHAVITGIVSAVHSDIPAWPGRQREDASEQMVYFGIKTADRIIEFECKSKGDKHMWTEGIQHMLNCCATV